MYSHVYLKIYCSIFLNIAINMVVALQPKFYSKQVIDEFVDEANLQCVAFYFAVPVFKRFTKSAILMSANLSAKH